MKRAVFAIAAISAATVRSAASAAGDILYVRGRFLAATASALAFTSGDAVALGTAIVPAGIELGAPIRAGLDRSTHRVVSIDTAPGPPLPGEIDAAKLPREFVFGRTALAAAPNETAGGATVRVTFRVAVPIDTPPSDGVYLSTDRTAFAANELSMNRLDAHTFTIDLDLPAGSTLQYLYTRGSLATVERERSGAVKNPRRLIARVPPPALPAPGGLPVQGGPVKPDRANHIVVEDTVVRWADQ